MIERLLTVVEIWLPSPTTEVLQYKPSPLSIDSTFICCSHVLVNYKSRTSTIRTKTLKYIDNWTSNKQVQCIVVDSIQGEKYRISIGDVWRETDKLIYYPETSRDMIKNTVIQYKNLVPEQVDRTSASTWLYKNPLITYIQNRPSTPHTYLANQSFVQLSDCSILNAQETGWQSVVYYSCGQ